MAIDTAQDQQTNTNSNELASELLSHDSGELGPSWSRFSAEERGRHNAPQQTPTNSSNQNRFRGHPVVRSPQQLHLHPILLRLNLVNSVVEFNRAIRTKDECLREPILITTKGTIISGFSEWHAAVKDSRHTVDCIEYSLNDEEAIQFMLIQHQPRRAWNSFTRIRLALELEPFFQAKALANQTAGGKYKGSANLPKPERIDVRQEIANVAGVGSRNVGNVRIILKKADKRIVEALQNGMLTIHRAVQWCSLSRTQQVEEFARYNVDRTTSKVIRQAIAHKKPVKTPADPIALLDALQTHEKQEPGSIIVRPSRGKQTVILIGLDLLGSSSLQAELEKS